MPIVSGEKLYEFSNAFWSACLNIPGWINEDLFILKAIPADKQANLGALKVSYGKNPYEKAILLLDDNSSSGKESGFVFSTDYFWGDLTWRFQYYNQEIDSVEITGAPNTPEFGALNVNNRQIGKLTIDRVQVLALKEYFRKLTMNDLSINIPSIQSAIDLGFSSRFLAELSKIGVAYNVLIHLQEDSIDAEEIVEDFGAVVLTNFRVIPKKLVFTVRYWEISDVVLVAPAVKEKHHMHIHPPDKLDLLHVGVFLVSAYLNIKGSIPSDDEKKYSLNFLIDGEVKLYVKSPSRDYLLKICEILKRFNVSGQLPV